MQEDTGFLMTNILRLLTLTFQTHEKLENINIVHADIIKRVEMCPGIRQFDLAERMSIQPIKISRMVDHLEKHKLIERRIPSNDHRVRGLYVTDSAKHIINITNTVIEDIWQPGWTGIDAEDIAIFRQVLSKINDNLVNKNSRFPN